MIKKKFWFGVLLFFNMFRRSYEFLKLLEWWFIVRDVKLIVFVNISCYGIFEEFCYWVKSLKFLSEWSFKVLFDRFVFKKVVELYFLLELEIVVDDSFGFIVKVFGLYLIEDYLLYLKYCCLV